MWIFNSVLNKVFDVLFLPVRGLGPWAAMILVSLLTSFLMLLIFRHTSNQAGIKKEKNLIKAHLLELRLFKDNMGVQLKAQGRILLANFKYVGHNMRPMLVMIVPVLLILIQLNLWFGAASLKPGDPVLVKVRLAEGKYPSEVPAALAASGELEVETPPLRIEDEAEIDWRLRAKTPGPGRLTLTVGGETVVKSASVGATRLSPIPSLKPGRNLLDQIFNPGEAPLPSSSVVRSVEVRYPSASMPLFGMHIHWLIVYFILSIAFGYAFKGLFKVEI
jgi:uncharacterized membrane protein (DUF106 family)